MVNDSGDSPQATLEKGADDTGDEVVDRGPTCWGGPPC